MKQYLHSLDYALWLATIALQWLFLYVALRHAARRQSPRFLWFVVFLCLKSTALLAISHLLPYSVYFWTFYAAVAIETVLLVTVVYEIFNSTFDPVGVLPAGSIARLLAFLMVSASLVIIAASWHPALTSGFVDSVTALLRTAHWTVVFLAALALWSLVMYSRSQAIPWRSRTAGIASGFLFSMSVNCFVLAGLCFAPQSWFTWLNRSYNAAFLVTLVMWLQTVCRPEEIALDLPAPEVLRKLNAAIAEMRTAARQLKIAQSLHPELKEE